MITISDLGEALIICDFNTKHILSNIYVDLMMVSMTLKLIETLVSFII